MPIRKQTIKKKCLFCGDSFRTTNPRREYDTGNCRKAAYYSRIRAELEEARARRAQEAL